MHACVRVCEHCLLFQECENTVCCYRCVRTLFVVAGVCVAGVRACEHCLLFQECENTVCCCRGVRTLFVVAGV